MARNVGLLWTSTAGTALHAQFRVASRRALHQWSGLLHVFVVRPRLRLPLPVPEAVCEGCGALLDVNDRHRAACPVSGRLKTRGAPTERVIARVCREAGATIRLNIMLKDMNVGVKAGDERRIEVLAQGLPLHGVAQLAVDASLRQFALSVEGILVHVPIVRTGPFSSMHVWTRRMLTRSCSKPVLADGGFRC